MDYFDQLDEIIAEEKLTLRCGCAPLWRCPLHARVKNKRRPDPRSEHIVAEAWRTNPALQGFLSAEKRVTAPDSQPPQNRPLRPRSEGVVSCHASPCESCGGAFPSSIDGRRARYCSEACKQRAKRARRATDGEEAEAIA